MSIRTDDLRDPAPPVPGAAERAAVAARANQLMRHRRMLQGAGALTVIAALTVGVVALATGSGGSSGSRSIQAAGDTSTTEAPALTTTTAPLVTTAPAPAVTAPAPDVTTPDTSNTPTDTTVPAADVPADTTPPAPAPQLATVSGTIAYAANAGPGVTCTVTLSGDGGNFSTTTDASGHFSISGVPYGTYNGAYECYNADGTAGQAGRTRAPVTINGDVTMSF